MIYDLNIKPIAFRRVESTAADAMRCDAMRCDATLTHMMQSHEMHMMSAYRSFISTLFGLTLNLVSHRFRLRFD